MITSAEKRITHILEEMAVAIVSGDAAPVFDRYTIPDYLFTSPAGVLTAKAEVLAGLRSGTIHFSSYKNEVLLIRRYGSVAIALGQAMGEGMNPGGETFRGSYRFTSVWICEEDDWRLAVWQATAIAQPDAPGGQVDERGDDVTIPD